jgi:hypothetical protein
VLNYSCPVLNTSALTIFLLRMPLLLEKSVYAFSQLNYGKAPNSKIPTSHDDEVEIAELRFIETTLCLEERGFNIF